MIYALGCFTAVLIVGFFICAIVGSFMPDTEVKKDDAYYSKIRKELKEKDEAVN